MARSRFERELEELNTGLIKLGTKTEQLMTASAKSLVDQNVEQALSVIEDEREIKMLASEIEQQSMQILLMQQPVASDLRKITTALKATTDIRRIADQSKDIAEIVINLCEEEDYTTPTDIRKMAESTKQMLSRCIESFVNMDIEIAKEVIEMDNIVDELFLKAKAALIALIRKNAKKADEAIYLMMIAKYLEKIGDHAENVAQWVIYCVTGERKIRKIKKTGEDGKDTRLKP
ncbi:MAG: phosphate signaling complex protein PhoU [Firmicutes bacterium]|nr:phosphate signaling complex protein PhoU [Bacillota bacterium]